MRRTHRQIQREQTCRQFDAAAGALSRVRPPELGWIRTTRLALGMTGAALSARLGGARTLAANLERSEQDGRITLASLQAAARAMGCRVAYAFVPEPAGLTDTPVSIETVLDAQAEAVARRLVRDAAVHMALEARQLDAATSDREVQRLKEQLLRDLPRELWQTLSRTTGTLPSG